MHVANLSLGLTGAVSELTNAFLQECANGTFKLLNVATLPVSREDRMGWAMVHPIYLGEAQCK